MGGDGAGGRGWMMQLESLKKQGAGATGRLR